MNLFGLFFWVQSEEGKLKRQKKKEEKKLTIDTDLLELKLNTANQIIQRFLVVRRKIDRNPDEQRPELCIIEVVN